MTSDWHETCFPELINSSIIMEQTRKQLRMLLVLAVLCVLMACGGNPQQKYARLLASGQRHLQNQDYARAILDLSSAAKIDSKSPELHYLLGLAYLGTGNLRNAVGQFNKTIALNPKHAGAQLQLAD